MGQTTNAVSSAMAHSSANVKAMAAPAAISLANIVTEADAAMTKLHDIGNSVNTDPTIAKVNDSLGQLTREIDEHQTDDARLLNSNASLTTLGTEQGAWQTLAADLALPTQTLASRITLLDGQAQQLNDWLQTWQATLASAQSSAEPPDILQRINEVLSTIKQTAKAVQDLRTQTLSAQGRVAEQGARIEDAFAAIKKAEGNAVGLLFVRDSVPLWETDFSFSRAATAGGQDSFAVQTQFLWAYLHDMAMTLIIHFFGFVLLAIMLVRFRRNVASRTKEEPALRHAAGVFKGPVAIAALLALLISHWLYPLAPRLFMAAVEAAALIPAVIILRRLIEPSLFVVLDAMIFFYIFDQVRHVTNAFETLSRSLFLGELIAGIFFLAWLIWSRRQRTVATRRDSLERTVSAFAHAALYIFLVAGAANVLGYVNLSVLLGNATFASGYWAVTLYAAAQIMDALALSAWQVHPLCHIGLVQRHSALLTRNLLRFFHWAAGLFWLWITLELFSLRAPLWAKAVKILTVRIGWGTQVPTLGDVLAFGMTVWASFVISKAIRFALKEEVFPRLNLPAGVPYTASTLAHYAVLLIGFFLAIEFLGIRLSNFAVLAGAFGVGLGFGLQNIMNNFVSGIILLFERPIKVGDVIQVLTTAGTPAIGTVERIGIRASVVLTTEGSEVIVPNGNLISNPVTNWTFSNRQRMVSIPVNIVSKSDPQHAMGLVVKVAQDHSLVIKDPPPQVLVTSLTATALSLELRVWTNHPAQWVQIRSDLSLAIHAALAKENIVTG